MSYNPLFIIIKQNDFSDKLHIKVVYIYTKDQVSILTEDDISPHNYLSNVFISTTPIYNCN